MNALTISIFTCLQFLVSSGQITQSPDNCTGWGSEIQELAHIATISGSNGSCSGVIADQETVLTTASCCRFAGLETGSGALVERGVHAFTRHCDGDLLEYAVIGGSFFLATLNPDFNSTTYSEDICVLRGYVGLGPHAVAIVPCRRRPDVGEICRLVGFVSTRNTTSSSFYSRARNEPVRIVSDEECTRAFNTTTKNSRWNDMCAEFVEDSSIIDDIEETDGGNAVICGTGDGHCFIGIVSLIPEVRQTVLISNRGLLFGR